MHTPPITPEERQRRREAEREATAHLRLEDLHTSVAADAIIRRHIDGDITLAEMLSQTKALHEPHRPLPLPRHEHPQESPRNPER